MTRPPASFVQQLDVLLRNLALALARLTRPFGSFGQVLAEGDDFHALASRLPGDASAGLMPLVLAAENVRHRFWQMPAFATENESPQPDWLAYTAVVAHIYAADAVISAPCDGAWDAYMTVLDLLDEVGQQTGDAALVPVLEAAVEKALADGDAQLPEELQREVEAAAATLRHQG